MKPRSASLFHFTNSFDKLCQILKNGFWPRYCLEDIGWVAEDRRFVALPMVCFCDIPISRIRFHADFYGSYAVGMKMEWGVANNLNPVFYLSKGNSLRDNLIDVHSGLVTENNKNALYRITYFIKPLTGKIKRGNTFVEKDFYDECEWRYLPEPSKDSLDLSISEQQFNDIRKLRALNQERLKDSMLTFSPKDVRYILVNDDSEIPRLVDFINSKLSHHSARDLKILVSRIIALSELLKDL